MAQTLLEYAKGSPDILVQAVVEEFSQTSDILAALPFQNIDGAGVVYNREDSLPGVGFRGVNESSDEGIGILNPQSDNLTIMSHDCDTDKFLVDSYGPSRRTTDARMAVKAAALKWTKTLIKGDSSSNPREFDGLQRRITGSQLIGMTAATATAGAALTLNKLDELIDQVDRPTHLLVNKTARRRLSAAARNPNVGGYITYDQDQFGRRVMFYNDLPLVVIDYDEAGEQILQYSEGNADGSTGTNTSIYCISAGEGMFEGIQGGVSSIGQGDKQYGIRVSDLGLITEDHKSLLRMRIEWYNGIAIWQSRAVARLAYIADGSVTA